MRFLTVGIICAPALFFGIPHMLSATTIVGIWTPKQITIAADSKQTMVREGKVVGSQAGCKVFEVRGIVVALAGLAATEGISVLDSIRNSRELVEQSTGVKLPETSLVVGAESALAQVLRNRKTSSDPSFGVALIIAGKIGGQLQMYRIEMAGMNILRDYAMPAATRRTAYPESRGYNGTDPNRGIEVIGIADAVKRFQTILPEWNKGYDLEVARRLVAIEAADAAGSQFVGAPISSVIIDKKGVRWIDKGICK